MRRKKLNTKTKTTRLAAILAIATVAILVSSTAIAKPALASSSNNNNHNNGHSVSKSDLRGVGNFLKCIANHGGNDISKKKSQDCVDNHLG